MNRRIETIERELERAYRALACAEMIDSTVRRDVEMKRSQGIIDRLEKQLEDARAGFNSFGSGPVPVEPREA